MFLMRFLVMTVVLVGLALVGLYALGSLVTPEQREVQVNLPLPRG